MKRIVIGGFVCLAIGPLNAMDMRTRALTVELAKNPLFQQHACGTDPGTQKAPSLTDNSQGSLHLEAFLNSSPTKDEMALIVTQQAQTTKNKQKVSVLQTVKRLQKNGKRQGRVE